MFLREGDRCHCCSQLIIRILGPCPTSEPPDSPAVGPRKTQTLGAGSPPAATPSSVNEAADGDQAVAGRGGGTDPPASAVDAQVSGLLPLHPASPEQGRAPTLSPRGITTEFKQKTHTQPSLAARAPPSLAPERPRRPPLRTARLHEGPEVQGPELHLSLRTSLPCRLLPRRCAHLQGASLVCRWTPGRGRAEVWSLAGPGEPWPGRSDRPAARGSIRGPTAGRTASPGRVPSALRPPRRPPA